MNRGVFAWWCAFLMLLLTGSVIALAISGKPARSPADAGIASRSSLPSITGAKELLNSSHRHPDWIHVPAGSATILTWVVYPDRADRAGVIIITAKDQQLSDWLRAVSDEVASEGFIAVVPDVSSNARAEIDAVWNYMARHPAANGKHANLSFSGDHIDISISGISKSEVSAGFPLSDQAWPVAMTFLNKTMENDPSRVLQLPAHVHGGHEMFEPEPQEQRRGGENGNRPSGGEQTCAVGSLNCKRDDMVAGFNTAKSTLAHSPIRTEWVDIPMGTARLHTRITYPQGTGKAPIVIVMTGANGLNDWMRSVGDQLSRQGFISISPDLHSGFGPNGGNWDSFEFPDDVVKATARIPRDEVMRRYKAARDYALKLPQANGKSASIGFCAGGTNSFTFAGEAPELNAAVVYYGTAPNETTMAKIKGPVLGLYGQIDARITESVEPTVAAMKKLGKIYEPHIYKDATHGFLEYQNLGENAKATADAWPRTIAFLKENTK
ncbi:MAG TPA: dienelactone hydrolase family protein [Terriglobia bacterium]|nr:dienelactone hydrolase family protein [Terriglobia bacterium]